MRLHAYTAPRHRCVATAGGTIAQRLYPGAAVYRLGWKNPPPAMPAAAACSWPFSVGGATARLFRDVAAVLRLRVKITSPAAHGEGVVREATVA